jgi:hypothetical protein
MLAHDHSPGCGQILKIQAGGKLSKDFLNNEDEWHLKEAFMRMQYNQNFAGTIKKKFEQCFLKVTKIQKIENMGKLQ